MVKILATLKSSSAKTCYLVQNFEPVIEKVYFLHCFDNKFFFHNLTGLANFSQFGYMAECSFRN